jgi:hypothetical protein
MQNASLDDGTFLHVCTVLVWRVFILVRIQALKPTQYLVGMYMCKICCSCLYSKTLNVHSTYIICSIFKQ